MYFLQSLIQTTDLTNKHHLVAIYIMLVGLLGKANVGKSTFFAAATETTVPTGNFPFTTISPNMGVAYIRVECACRHFEIEHNHPLCHDGVRRVPIKLIDIAGLVPGAHQGRGLGNKFLDDARQANVLVHVVDAAGSTDLQGQPVPTGSHDPSEDVRFVQEEFDMWFLNILKREWDKILREMDQKRMALVAGIAARFTGLGVTIPDVQAALQRDGTLPKNPREWSDDDIHNLVRNIRRTTKPMLVAANKADLHPVSLEVDHIPCSAETELALRRAAKAGLVSYGPGDGSFDIVNPTALSAPQQKALERMSYVMDQMGTTGVQEVLERAVLDILNMIPTFPVEDESRLTNKDGEVLPDVKLLPRGSTAVDLAGAVHTDMSRGFLYGIDCKTRQRVGAAHTLKAGDVIKIVSTLGRS